MKVLQRVRHEGDRQDGQDRAEEKKVGQRNYVTFCFCFQFACKKGDGKGSSDESGLSREVEERCGRGRAVSVVPG